MSWQPIINIAEIAFQKGVTNIVISPGSRSALLTLAFSRHPGIKTYIIKDERSAGYFALGLSQEMKKPVGIVCTSGTAVLNLYPAIAESYFQQIPLVVFTADRPPEWIGQNDGQTIFQERVFSNHVKKSYSFPDINPVDDALWHGNRIINEAINLSDKYPQGPVHINIPISEPFYPDNDYKFIYNKNCRIIKSSPALSQPDENTWLSLDDQWNQSKKILIVVGQHFYDVELLNILEDFRNTYDTPILGDIHCNIQDIGTAISNHELILYNRKIRQELAPDLLITFGKSVLSKNLKLFLRESHTVNHWHIQEEGTAVDTFQNLTYQINCSPGSFFKEGKSRFNKTSFLTTYFDQWQEASSSAYLNQEKLSERTGFSEFSIPEIIAKKLPENCNLHLANSMPVRLFNMGHRLPRGVEVFANRGTSGIDGCTSSAVGVAAETEKLNILITGDMAFFYDRNAFWNDYIKPNLRIIVINNHGGGIFSLINGPSELPELNEFFETNQPLNAKYTAQEFGFDYCLSIDEKQLNNILVDFMKPSKKPIILEIETDKKMNKKIFNKIKAEFI